jgi:hypothetical protein
LTISTAIVSARDVSGVITNNTVWGPNEIINFVDGVTVNPDVKLLIQDNVTVNLSSFPLTVYGHLTARNSIITCQLSSLLYTIIIMGDSERVNLTSISLSNVNIDTCNTHVMAYVAPVTIEKSILYNIHIRADTTLTFTENTCVDGFLEGQWYKYIPDYSFLITDNVFTNFTVRMPFSTALLRNTVFYSSSAIYDNSWFTGRLSNVLDNIFYGDANVGGIALSGWNAPYVVNNIFIGNYIGIQVNYNVSSFIENNVWIRNTYDVFVSPNL